MNSDDKMSQTTHLALKIRELQLRNCKGKQDRRQTKAAMYDMKW